MHIKIVLIGIILESIENHLSVALIIWYADRRLSWPPSPLVQLANFEIEPRMAAPLTSPSSSTPLINQTSLYYSFLCPHISLHSPFEPPQISADSDLPACTLPDLLSSIPRFLLFVLTHQGFSFSLSEISYEPGDHIMDIRCPDPASSASLACISCYHTQARTSTSRDVRYHDRVG